MQLQLDGEASVLLVEIGSQELLCRGWLSLQKHSAGRQFSSAGFYPGDPCAEMASRLCFLNLSPVSH